MLLGKQVSRMKSLKNDVGQRTITCHSGCDTGRGQEKLPRSSRTQTKDGWHASISKIILFFTNRVGI